MISYWLIISLKRRLAIGPILGNNSKLVCPIVPQLCSSTFTCFLISYWLIVLTCFMISYWLIISLKRRLAIGPILGNNSELVRPVVPQLWLHLHVLPDHLHFSQMVAGYWSTPRPIACYWSIPGQEFLASQPFRTTARVPDSSASWPVRGSIL